MAGLSSITKNVTGGGEGIGLYLDGASKYWGVSLLATAAAGAVSLVDTSNPLPISDAGGSITVDGTVGVSGSVAVTGTFWQATQPVSLASVPSHAVTNVGTFAVQDSEKIADNAGFTDGTTKVLPLGMIYDEVAGTALSENDIGTPRMDAKRGVVVVVEDATTRGQRMAVAATGEAAANVAKINGVAPSMGNGASGTGVQRVTIASDSTGQVALAAGTNGIGKLTANSGVVIGDVNVVAGINPVVNVSASYTRPADTTAYAAGDCYNSSTSSPTVLTFTSAARASGKGGVVTSLTVVDSNAPGTPIQGELWLFDSAPTSTNDNAAYALSDSDALKLVGVIPFTTVVTAANNSIATVQGLSIAFQCSGSADLRGQVRVTNAYTPASAETLGFRLGIIQGD